MRHRRSRTTGSGGRRLLSGAAAVLLAGGIATVGVGLRSEASTETAAYQSTVVPSSPPALPPLSTAPPAPEASTVPAVPAAPIPAAPDVPGASGGLVGPVLPFSEPLRVASDIIGVDSSLMKLGLEPDGTVAVPPGDAGSPAGWYEGSPTPGELGASVILGHVNSTQTGIGVFYRLHELQDADQVSVARADGTVAVFQVYRTDTYDEDNFPTVEVYGPTDRAELRLITCGGYEPSTGEFTQNTVVYAYLLSSYPA
ncbi:class F sortase [Arthrobacter sp. CAN_A6]|uniref:class F sortase n=1 Tax=Arthrobacter sp. CAN_A6 TaxID=2787721 RepID=UPI0018C973BB